MSRVAIVTDSASDMDPARAAALGIAIVPLLVSFGDDTFSAGIDLTRDDFWTRVKTPGSPIATTAACSPGTFQQVYQKAFDDGADSIVSVHVADTLSGTLKAAQVAKAEEAAGLPFVSKQKTASPDTYLMSHTGVVRAYAPDGRLYATYPFGTKPSVYEHDLKILAKRT